MNDFIVIPVIEHDGARIENVSVKDALEKGVPQATINAALAKHHVDLIKKECRRRIYAIASSETQMNMSTAAAVISGKTASNRSAAEKTILASAEKAIGWVAAMRANIATLAANPNADIKANASWPDCPAEVIALAAMF